MEYTGSDAETKPSASEEDYFLSARPGDSLCCPFQCDECVFHRLIFWPSNVESKNNQILLDFIRRANLDDFWYRAPGTIYELNRMFDDEIMVGKAYGFQMCPKAMGPFLPDYDRGVGLILEFFTDPTD
jgi:hypothetical protein